MCFSVSESGKPIIWPNQEEILINEGDSLEIICNGTTQIKFIYPNNNEEIVCTNKLLVYKFLYFLYTIHVKSVLTGTL